jgi:hypothetical protein
MVLLAVQEAERDLVGKGLARIGGRAAGSVVAKPGRLGWHTCFWW